jgi:hypothetical protein
MSQFRVFLSPEPLMGRRFAVFFRFQRDTDHSHPQRDGPRNYARPLSELGRDEAAIRAAIDLAHWPKNSAAPQ